MAVRVSFYPIFCEQHLYFARAESANNIFQNASRQSLVFPEQLALLYPSIEMMPVNILGIQGVCHLIHVAFGMICLQVERSYEINSLLAAEIVSSGEADYSHISEWSVSEEAQSLISRFFPSSEVEVGKFHAAYAYSHTLFIEDDTLEDYILPVESDGVFAFRRGSISVRASPSILIVNVKDTRTSDLMNYIMFLTVLIASLYEIQKSCLLLSRKIAHSADRSAVSEFDFDELHRKLGLYSQHLAEVAVNDFLANPIEEAIGATLGKAWRWEDVVTRTASLVESFRSQLSNLDAAKSRSLGIASNRVLFAFTFISVLEVASSLIQLYDIEGAISPALRIISACLALFAAIALAQAYILAVKTKLVRKVDRLLRRR